MNYNVEMEDLSLLESLKTVYSLTQLDRRGWIIRGVLKFLRESVATHCKNSAMAAFHYTKNARLTAMLGIHDWSESLYGDKKNPG